MTTSDTGLRVAAEIRAFHADLALWLSGRCPRDASWFDVAFARRLHADLFNVQPAGVVLTRQDLLNGLEAGHGCSPDFDICIRNAVLRQTVAGGQEVLATYEEYQRGARNSRSENARLSTVLFEREGCDRLVWRAIHETWLPEDKHIADNFSFPATVWTDGAV